jgi:anti-anti-sigma factor
MAVHRNGNQRAGLSAFAPEGGSVQLKTWRVDSRYQVLLEFGDPAAINFDADAIRNLSARFDSLFERGYNRLLLKLDGISYLSGAMLGLVAGLHQHAEHAQGRLGLVGLTPAMMELLRICHLERVLHIHTEEYV